MVASACRTAAGDLEAGGSSAATTASSSPAEALPALPLPPPGLAEEVRGAVREDFLQLQREWSAQQAEVQRQQLDCLVASLERQFQLHSRQICWRLGSDLRRMETAACGGAAGAPRSVVQFAGEDLAPQDATAISGRGDISREMARRRTAQPSPAGPSTRELVSVDADEAATPSAPTQIAPPVAPRALPGSDVVHLRLPAAAVRPSASSMYRAAGVVGTPMSCRRQAPGSSGSDLGLDEDAQVPDECDYGGASGRRGRLQAVDRERSIRSLVSPWSARSAFAIDLPTDRSFRSEATQENDKERHQWRHKMRQQITRRVSDINGQSYLAHTVSGLFGLRGHLQTLRRQRTEGTLNERRELARSRLERLVDSHTFHLLCGLIIAANAIFIGFETDIGIRNALARPRIETPEWIRIVNQSFVAVFVVEVMMRLMAKRCRFFFADDGWRWNIFDLLLTVYAVTEEWCTHLEEQGGFSLTYTRLVRGFRMVRILRIIRVMRCFRELRLMVCSTMRSIGSLSWALVLMGVIIYLFTVCFMHGATVYLQEGHDGIIDGKQVRELLETFYGSLPCAMLTLLMAVSGGDDWINFVQPLGVIHPLYQALFAFYVFFVVIGVVNVVTSAFVQRSVELSRLDRDLLIQGEMVSQEAWVEEMRGIFEEVDADNSGQITWEEFRQFMENPQVQAYFATQQLDTSDAPQLFALLDTDGNGSIGMEEFIMGCQKLRGQAKSSDVATLLRENKRTSQKFLRAMRKMEVRVGALCGTMGVDLAEFSQASFLQSPKHLSDSGMTPVSTFRGGMSPAAILGRARWRGLFPRSRSTTKAYV
mmetsp:Transcript_57664/g.187352  ORF Transcript_57664/g.187352 Transcript_57664/m.187352 type:complete len:820 (-) Transcript_57664:508-2967(-)